MRELKFRAWGHHDVIVDFDDVILGDKTMLKDIEVINSLDEMSYDPSRFIFMQYTGLKDKNGIEIYEGDIIRIYHNDTSLKVDTSEVFFKDGEFSYYDWAYGNKHKTNYPLCAVSSESGIDHEGSHFCEVIGNIYENPELLES